MLRSCALLSMAMMACSEPSIAFSDLDQALQQARCERLARCQLFPDDDSCLRFFRIVPDRSLAGAVAAHTVGYAGQQARHCVDAIARQSCDLTAHDAHVEPAACAAMFEGALAGGEDCSIDAECASGTCELPAVCPPTSCCIGACRPTQPPGSSGTSCAKARDCRDGLVCGSDRTCHLPAAAGEPCGSERECGDGLGCVGVLSTMLGTCRALPHAGQPCPYLRCADANLRCDDITHSCVPVGLPGDPCPGSNECASGLECDPITLSCREYPTLGMACNGVCGGDAFCAFDRAPIGTCVAPLPNTSPCDGYNQCASFYCEQGPLFDSCKDPYVCF